MHERVYNSARAAALLALAPDRRVVGAGGAHPLVRRRDLVLPLRQRATVPLRRCASRAASCVRLTRWMQSAGHASIASSTASASSPCWTQRALLSSPFIRNVARAIDAHHVQPMQSGSYTNGSWTALALRSRPSGHSPPPRRGRAAPTSRPRRRARRGPPGTPSRPAAARRARPPRRRQSPRRRRHRATVVLVEDDQRRRVGVHAVDQLLAPRVLVGRGAEGSARPPPPPPSPC